MVLVIASFLSVAAFGDAVRTSELGTRTAPGAGWVTITFAACDCTPDDEAVIVADPSDPTAVTIPEALTVATAELLDDQVIAAPGTAVPDCCTLATNWYVEPGLDKNAERSELNVI